MCNFTGNNFAVALTQALTATWPEMIATMPRVAGIVVHTPFVGVGDFYAPDINR